MTTRKILHIFRRDHRLTDNTALLSACDIKDVEIIPIFIFTHKQIRDNPLKSDRCVKFMCESLIDLNSQLEEKGSKLLIVYGDEFEILERIFSHNPDIYGVSFNIDYTEYALKRDQQIIDLIMKLRPINNTNSTTTSTTSTKSIATSKKQTIKVDIENVENRANRTINDLLSNLPENIIIREDYMINPVNTILTTGKKMYTKYTPYYRASLANALKHAPEPRGNNCRNFASGAILSRIVKNSRIGEISATPTNLSQFYQLPPTEKLLERGGRTRAREILTELRNWRNYDELRDQLTYNTTHLSPFNKFGCISCREVFHTMRDKLGPNCGLIAQMIWRDFFYNLSFNHPEIYRQSMNPKFAHINWPETAETRKRFNAWCQGHTGYPIVDACMREINQSGYMHNRGRLIVANFLSRLLQIDWRKGEHYFARNLYDYDPALNNFGWQICATVSGTESRPLNQTIFNPWLQSAKFDPDAEYIKKWIPELKDIPANKIHRWNEFGEDILKNNKNIKYLIPIVEYLDEKEKNLKLYKQSYK